MYNIDTCSAQSWYLLCSVIKYLICCSYSSLFYFTVFIRVFTYVFSRLSIYKLILRIFMENIIIINNSYKFSVTTHYDDVIL